MRDHRRHRGSTDSAARTTSARESFRRFGPALAACVAVVLLILSGAGAAASAAASSGPPAVPDELIVGFRSSVAQGQQDVALQEAGGAATLRRFGPINASLVHTRPGESAGVASALATDPRVRYVEPNYIVSATLTPNDPSYGQLWGMNNTGQTGGTADADIDAPEAWNIETGSSSVVVDVTDTGVDFSHPDLAAQQWINSGENCGSTDATIVCAQRTNGVDDDANGFVDDYRGWDFVNHDNNPFDDNSHGTHVSGTIGAVGNNNLGVVGVNWNVKIMALKFLNASGSGSTADALSATLYAANKGAAVSNNSWGGGGADQSLLDAIEYGASHGMLFVAAAGNNNSNNETAPFYPASYNSDVIASIAATDHNDARASFSNYGATTVDLGAPGVNILSTVPNNGYAPFNGTSMATPHVSGAAALLKAHFPSATAYGLKALLMRSVDPKPSMQGITVTGGRLNVFNAVSCANAPKTVLLTPLNGFTVQTGQPLAIRMFGANCASPAGIGNVSVNVNGTPVTMTAASPDSGRYSGTYTPTNGGPLVVTATVTINGSSDVATASGTASGGNSPTITTTSLPGGTVSQAYSQSVTATGGTGPYSWAVISGSLPPNLSLSPTGTPSATISGTPTTAGTYNFTVQVTDNALRTDTQALSITIAPTTTGPYTCQDVSDGFIDATGGTLLPLGVDDGYTGVNLPFSFPYFASSHTQAFVSSNGFLTLGSGTGANMANNVTIPTTTNPNGVVAPFWDDLNPKLGGGVYSLVTGSAPNRVFTVEWFNVPHFNNVGAATFEASLYETSGLIRFRYLDTDFGNATFNAGASATAGVESQNGTTGTKYSFNQAVLTNGKAISCSQGTQPPPPLNITTTSLPAGTVNQAYSQSVTATGGTTPYSWAVVSGSLPPNLSLSPTGTPSATISGTPTTAGTYNFTVQVTDNAAQTDTQALSITVAPVAAPVITTTTLPGGTVSQAYSQSVTATGGTTPYSWSVVSGSLPPNLSLSPTGTPSATISGTPTTAGTYNFTVQVTDNAAQTDTQDLSITIAPVAAPIITTTSLPAGTVNQAYSQSVTATGGTTPYSWAVVSGSLPPNLSLSPTGTPSATISGTPTTAGTYNFTVQVTDNAAQTDTQDLSITISSSPPPGAPQFGSAGAAAGALGTSINVPYPSGINANDVLILLVMTRDGNDIATPAGFTQGDARGQNSTLRAEWFWKRATGSESGTVNVTKASGSALLYGRMYRYTGAVTSGNPFEAAAQAGAGANATMTPADITTTGPNRRVVVLVAEADNQALGDFTGGTATVSEETPEATTTTGTRGALGVNGAVRTSAGAFDCGTYVIGAASGHIEFTFALLPA